MCTPVNIESQKLKKQIDKGEFFKKLLSSIFLKAL